MLMVGSLHNNKKHLLIGNVIESDNSLQLIITHIQLMLHFVYKHKVNSIHSYKKVLHSIIQKLMKSNIHYYLNNHIKLQYNIIVHLKMKDYMKLN